MSLTNILLIIVIVLNSLGLYFLTGNSLSVANMTIDPLDVKGAILSVEYDKAWGKEIYDLLAKAQQLSLNDPQNPSNLKAMKQYIESFGTRTAQQTEDTGTTDNSPALTLTGEKLSKIVDGSSIEWNKDADILVIEYSDMECPFCVRQYHDTKLGPKLLEKYGDKISFAFKNNKGVNHPGTEAKAIGALCAKKVAWDDAYIKFYKIVMDGTTQSTGVYDVARIPEAAKLAWADEKKWKDCYDSKATSALFEQETAEAQGFNLGGTPGTLILNVKTWEYATVEWAYPLDTFTQKIDQLMK